MARHFLLDHGYSPAEAQTIWLSIALHTTPGIPEHLEPEVHLVTLGVETDVLGIGWFHGSMYVATFKKGKFAESWVAQTAIRT